MAYEGRPASLLRTSSPPASLGAAEPTAHDGVAPRAGIIGVALPWAIAGITTLVVAVSISLIALGHIQSVAARPFQTNTSRLALGVCDGIPCYGSLIPTRTTLSDANQLLTNYKVPHDAVISIYPSLNRQAVAAVSIGQPGVVLGDILSLYGPPSCIGYYRRDGTVMVHYPMLHLMARVPDNRWGPRTRVAMIVLGNPVPPAGQTTAICAHVDEAGSDPNAVYREYAWHGFASLLRYPPG